LDVTGIAPERRLDARQPRADEGWETSTALGFSGFAVAARRLSTVLTYPFSART
jgi:hypothetical protein